ncbi:hypothetical protein IWZ00DRAFT_572677 [Phyllosticta capitalensis]|uniref:uncharacterized protein n=1 Tax=Phyllosticta capitalensis TaxID=121624 RepID=UPI0031328BB5
MTISLTETTPLTISSPGSNEMVWQLKSPTISPAVFASLAPYASPQVPRRSTRLQSQAMAASKRGADDADLSSDGSASKRRKFETSTHQQQPGVMQHASPGKKGEGFSWSRIAAKGHELSEKVKRKSPSNSPPKKHESKPVITTQEPSKKEKLHCVEPGMIVYAVHLTKYMPDQNLNESQRLNDEKNIARNPQGNIQVYCKERYFIVLRTEPQHLVVLPCFTSDGRGLTTKWDKDKRLYLAVKHKDDLSIFNDSAHKSVVLRVEYVTPAHERHFPTWGKNVCYAKFMGPTSLGFTWEMDLVGRIDDDSYDRLLQIFAREMANKDTLEPTPIFPSQLRLLALNFPICCKGDQNSNKKSGQDISFFDSQLYNDVVYGIGDQKKSTSKQKAFGGIQEELLKDTTLSFT